MSKCAILLQYLEDHARLVCDKLNESGGTAWSTRPIPDDMRRNIIFHFGWSSRKLNSSPETYKGLQSPPPPTKLKLLPTLEPKRISSRRARMSLKRLVKLEGIFSKGISNAEPRDDPEPPDAVSPSAEKASTSPIYEDSRYSDSACLFREPSNMDLAEFFHHQSMSEHRQQHLTASSQFENPDPLAAWSVNCSFSQQLKPQERNARQPGLQREPRTRPATSAPFSQPNFLV